MVLGVLGVVGARPAGAAPADPRVRPLVQPDGTTFPARLWGDEYLNGFETSAGYTVVRDADGRWAFARADAGGDLSATAVPPGPTGIPPRSLGVQRHLRDSGELRQAEALREEAAGLDAGGAREATSLGTAPTLVMLVRFVDRAEQTTTAHWHERLFGPTGSVADYYHEVSGGRFDVVPAAETSGVPGDGVVGWISLPTPHPDTAGQVGSVEARVLVASVLRATDAFVDFGAYDTRAPIGQITPDELHLVMVPAGNEAADGCDGPTIWAHRGSLSDDDVDGAVPPVLDGVIVGDGSTEGGYVMASEMGCDAGGTYPQSIGILAHELGHDLGFLDLYDVDGSSAGVDQWSLMGQHRGQLPGEPSGTHPPHVDPFHKWFAGWVAPTQVATPQGVALDQVETSGQVAQIRDNPGGVDVGFLHRDQARGEYFLVENREPIGYDVALPGCGLLIWHIDESSFGNGDESRRLVDLEEAGEAGNPDGGYADDSDPWPGSGGATLFDTTSTPDSRSNDGRPTGVSVRTVDVGCAPVMHADIDPGGGVSPSPPPPPPNDDLADALPLVGAATATGYNEGATLEAGEPHHDGESGGASVWWKYTPPLDGLANVAIESTFDGVMAVYRGPSVDHLTRVTSGPATTSAVGAEGAVAGEGAAGAVPEDLDVGPPSFPVEAGDTYWIAVDGRDLGAGAATGGIRLSVRFDPIAVAVTTSPAHPAPGAPVSVEVAVSNLEPFLALRVDAVYDDAGHDCVPEPSHLPAGDTARCRFSLVAPDRAGDVFGSTVSTSGEWDDARFFYQRVAWEATVAASGPPPPTAPTEPHPDGGRGGPALLARTGADPGSLVVVAVALVVLGGACIAGSRRRRARAPST